ncbi:MAG: hypothetical protein FWD88_01465, partial [Treponema sp.]|nr:hypothetical protein [Treponema sp.]
YYCSCPSCYHPCKHIGIIENAIASQAADENRGKQDRLQMVEKTIGNVPAERLREFIVGQARCSDELQNAILLAFAADVENAEGNRYSPIIRSALASFAIPDDQNYYYDGNWDIEALDQWFDKAREYADLEQYDDAILVCKACIEEYSQWLYDTGDKTDAMFSQDYEAVPLNVIEKVAEHADKKELFDYCISEMKKRKYEGTYFIDGFHRLLAAVAPEVDPDRFIAMQDELLACIADRSSDKAESILRRKIDFHKRLGHLDKAWSLVEENIQIAPFRLQTVEKKIQERDFQAAKKFVNDFLAEQKEQNGYHGETWHKLLLDIAQKENDIPAVRTLTYGFIKTRFRREYFEIYKRSFGPDEWADERERLYLCYGGEKHFNPSAADFMAAEGDTVRLAAYIEKHLSAERLERYYRSIAHTCPGKTLELFQKAISQYAEDNVGRSHYEHVLSMLEKMAGIKGGKEMALDLVRDFRVRYRNRKAMLDVMSDYPAS